MDGELEEGVEPDDTIYKLGEGDQACRLIMNAQHAMASYVVVDGVLGQPIDKLNRDDVVKALEIAPTGAAWYELSAIRSYGDHQCS